MIHMRLSALKLDKARASAQQMNNWIQSVAAASNEIVAALEAYEIPPSVAAACDWPAFLAYLDKHDPDLACLASEVEAQRFEVQKNRKLGILELTGAMHPAMMLKMRAPDIEMHLLKFSGKRFKICFA